MYVILLVGVTYTLTLSPVGVMARQRIYDDVQGTMGFHHYTPYIEGREVLALRSIEPGKPMDRAGFRPGDRIELDAVDDLYSIIASSEGRTAAIPVTREGRRFVIEVIVPDLKLRGNPRVALWYR